MKGEGREEWKDGGDNERNEEGVKQGEDKTKGKKKDQKQMINESTGK